MSPRSRAAVSRSGAYTPVDSPAQPNSRHSSGLRSALIVARVKEGRGRLCTGKEGDLNAILIHREERGGERLLHARLQVVVATVRIRVVRAAHRLVRPQSPREPCGTPTTSRVHTASAEELHGGLWSVPVSGSRACGPAVM